MRRLAAILAILARAGGAEDWPQFRGPRGDGTSRESLAAPLKLRWKAPLPGPGHSSPAVWGERIFLTAFEPETRVWRQLAGYRGRLLVLAFHALDGRELWRYEVPARDIEKTTAINSPASPTPATDGKRVYAFFGSYGLVALTIDGRPVWQRPIGPHPNHMGAGSSPILAGGRLYLNAETDGPSHLYAIDTASGRVQWRSPRKTRQAGYASPVLWHTSVVVAGHQSVIAYDDRDGREKWRASALSQYVVPTPVHSAGLLYATSSGPGGNTVVALRPDGSQAWQVSRGAAYVASPVLADGKLFTVNSNCVAAALDPADGRLLWQQRLPGDSECYASPVSSEGRVHFATSTGTLLSIATPTFAIDPPLRFGGKTLASPAIANGVLYLRTQDALLAYSSAALQ